MISASVRPVRRIISALTQYEGGEKTADICCKLGISHATLYLWKKQYAGIAVQELRNLRSLREENGQLKRIIADLTLDLADPAEDRVKKAVKPAQ